MFSGVRKAFRVNADELMASANCGGIGDDDYDSVFESIDPSDDGSPHQSNEPATFTVISEPSSPDSEHDSSQKINPIASDFKQGQKFEGVRAFGVSMCNQVMRTLPDIPESTVHKCLRNLTTSDEGIDSTVFIEIEEEVST